MQSVEGAADNDGLVGVGRRERRKHHGVIMVLVNRHSMCSNCFRSTHEEGVVLGKCHA